MTRRPAQFFSQTSIRNKSNSIRNFTSFRISPVMLLLCTKLLKNKISLCSRQIIRKKSVIRKKAVKNLNLLKSNLDLSKSRLLSIWEEKGFLNSRILLLNLSPKIRISGMKKWCFIQLVMNRLNRTFLNNSRASQL
jgi:hypothetical protein